MAKLELSTFENILFTVVENAIYKTISAIELYCTKYSYNQAYFLCIIAEEELAKLIILPIAKELDELKKLVNNRRNSYYNHSIKQKLFTSYGLQNRTSDEIESIKQQCLYVGIDENLKPIYARLKPDIVYLEIKHTTFLLTSSTHKILRTSEVSDDLKKCILFLLNLLKGCVNDKMPELKEDILKESDEFITKLNNNPDFREERYLEELFSNPFELIRIFKAVFMDDYQKHLEKIKTLPFNEMVKYLGNNLS